MGPAAEQVVHISMEKMGPNLGSAPCQLVSHVAQLMVLHNKETENYLKKIYIYIYMIYI